MNGKTIMLAVCLLTIGLISCTTSRTPQYERAGRVISTTGKRVPGAIVPATIVEIDGNSVLRRNRSSSFKLQPGPHTVRVWPEKTIRLRGEPIPYKLAVANLDTLKTDLVLLEIDIEPGHRYRIGARITRHRTTVEDQQDKLIGSSAWRTAIVPVVVEDPRL